MSMVRELRTPSATTGWRLSSRSRITLRPLTSSHSRPGMDSGVDIGGDPVGDVVDAHLAVVDLAVLRAALLGGEDLELLALGADPLVQRLRLLHRHDAVVLAVGDEKRALDLVRDALEGELLRPLQRR